MRLKQVNHSYSCPAWDRYMDSPTNYKLNDGEQVRLVSMAVGETSSGYYLLPLYAICRIIKARVPKVSRIKGSSLYFAYLECEVDGVNYKVRVPHGAIRKMK